MHTEAGLGILASFLIGSIPFGWLIAKLWGVKDVRKVGSSNIGATNVTRTAGKLAGGLTFALDFAKGLVPMLYFPEATIWFGFAAVAGHCFSPFLSFRGGKGVSTTLGALVAYNPWLGGTCIATYLLGLLLTRVSALGSLFAMIAAIGGTLLFAPLPRDKIAVTIMVAIVLVRHRDNWNTLLRVLALGAFTGLLAASPQPANAATQDYRGRDIDSSLHPKRIVALMPNLAETIVDLGAGDKLVAAPNYSRLPKSVLSHVKDLGPYNHVSAEVIYSVKPDLVLVSMDGNDPEQVKQLEKLGLRIVTVNTQSLADIVRSMKIVAAAVGDVDKSKIATIEQALDPARASKGAMSPRTFVQVGWEPLVTISKQTFIDELLDLAGGTNVFRDAQTKYPRPNPEEVIVRNPEVIVICQLTDDGTEARKARDYWLRFTKIAAVQSNRVYIVKGDWLTKPGFPLLRGLEELKKILR